MEATTTPTTAPDFWASPLAATIEKCQDAGRSVYVWGLTPNGRFALVVDADKGEAYVASVDAHASLGRFENHVLIAPAEVYGERFPIRP